MALDKSAKRVSQFLKKHYGITMRIVNGIRRRPLLDDVETVACNLCGASDAVVVAEREKHGLPVHTVMCRHCGLLYLNPRPTAQAYASFYAGGGTRTGAYHTKMGYEDIPGILQLVRGPDFQMGKAERKALDEAIQAAKNSLVAPQQEAAASGDEDGDEVAGESGASSYPESLVDYAGNMVAPGSRVFEVGASWGRVLLPWRTRLGCELGGVEPKLRSVERAKELHGIDLFPGFSNNPDIPANHYDLVLNVRTINHQLDPLTDLRLAWGWLRPGGLLLVDIQDSIEKARYKGFEENVVEIDHPYMFSRETLAAMVQKAGFDIVRTDLVDVGKVYHGAEVAARPWQARILARKREAVGEAVVLPDASAQLDRLNVAKADYGKAKRKRFVG